MTTDSKKQLRQQIVFLNQKNRQLERKIREYEAAEERRIRRVAKETPTNDEWRQIL